MLYYILFNENITPEQAIVLFLLSVLAFFITLTLHEFSRAFVAYKMGDSTPKATGKLTLNPFKHLNPMGFIFFILCGIGWGNPTPINSLNFKNYKKGIRGVAASGLIVNFLLGLLSAGLYLLLMKTIGVANEAMQYIFAFLDIMMLVNSFFVMFSIIPIYPFDGFAFISTYLKPNSKYMQTVVKNSARILLSIILVCLVLELLFNIDLLDWYLSVLYSCIFRPIALL